MRRLALLLACTVLLAGCPQGTRIDGSSKDAFKSSQKKMREELPKEKQEELDKALKILAFSDFDSLGDLLKAGQDPEALAERVREKLAGKTADEIIAAAAKVTAEREAKAREGKVKELEKLNEALQSSLKARAGLQKFKVRNVRLSRRKLGFSLQSFANLTVTNGTSTTVSRAYFRAELITPGREVPWVSSEFNYSIPGGLEPGESAEWELTLSDYQGWASAPRDRFDTALLVQCVRLDDPNKKAFLQSEFDRDDMETLKKLTEEVGSGKADAGAATLKTWEEGLSQMRSALLKQTIQEEIAYLSARRKAREEAEEKLSALVVTRSKFYFKRSRFSKDPVIELDARNDTGVTISRVFAEGTVKAPGREVPYLKEDFNFTCEGGLASGASKSWSFSPNRYSEWGKVPSDRNDLILEVRIKGLAGADGKDLFAAAEFEEADEKRLKALSELRVNLAD